MTPDWPTVGDGRLVMDGEQPHHYEIWSGSEWISAKQVSLQRLRSIGVDGSSNREMRAKFIAFAYGRLVSRQRVENERAAELPEERPLPTEGSGVVPPPPVQLVIETPGIDQRTEIDEARDALLHAIVAMLTDIRDGDPIHDRQLMDLQVGARELFRLIGANLPEGVPPE